MRALPSPLPALYSVLDQCYGALLRPLMGENLAEPAPLQPLHRVWVRLGSMLCRIAIPIVMPLLFVTTVVPMGLVMRALGKDPLRLRREPKAASYWILRDPPGPAPETMKHQF